MRALIFGSIAFSIAVVCVADDIDKLPSMRRTKNQQALRTAIELAQRQVATFKRGHVVVGQIVVGRDDDPESVISQMKILQDGTFATATKDLERPVAFRKIGYEPLDLRLKGKTGIGGIIDVGVLKMIPFSKSSQVPLKGKIELEGGAKDAMISISVSPLIGPVNTVTNGTEARAKFDEKLIQVPMSGILPGSADYSPIRCYASISADGYVKKLVDLDFRPQIGADIGTITLEKPRRARLEFIRFKDGKFDPDLVETVEIKGGDEWKPKDDSAGYGHDLRFQQKERRLQFETAYGPSFMARLGAKQLKDAAGATPEMAKGAVDGPLEDGHVYLLDMQHFKRAVLFRVTLLND